MEADFDFSAIIRVLIVGAVIVASLLKRVGKHAKGQETFDEQESQGDEANMPRNIFDMMRENLERIDKELRDDDESEVEKRVAKVERPRVVVAPKPKFATSGGGAQAASKPQPKRAIAKEKIEPLSPIHNDEIGEENSGEILEDFDLKKAVIYHEILTPKFDE